MCIIFGIASISQIAPICVGGFYLFYILILCLNMHACVLQICSEVSALAIK